MLSRVRHNIFYSSGSFIKEVRTKSRKIDLILVWKMP